MLSTILCVAGLISTILACGVPEIHDRSATLAKTAITNVHVWNGKGFSTRTSTVVLVGGIITNANAAGGTVINGEGGYLMPGLIDSHCHLTNCSQLASMREFGITTALDMGSFPYSSVTACRKEGATSILGSGAAGTVNGSKISIIPNFPTESFLSTRESAEAFVDARIYEDVDYIKVFLDTVGPSVAILDSIVEAAHRRGKLVISHATTYTTYNQAATAGVDIITHAPLDKALDVSSISNLTNSGAAIMPTLFMMQSTVNNTGAPFSLYTINAQGSVTTLHNVGLTIVAGTDANDSIYVPANPLFGESLHDELALLVAAGLSPAQALASATSVAASTFRLYDRGAIKPGLRADLVLMTADPTVAISNSRSIFKVWVGGIMTSVQ